MHNGYSSVTQKKLDKQIMRIAERSDILKFLDPTNKFEELQKFIDAKGDYNPQFIYNTDHVSILGEVSLYVNKLKAKTAKLRVNDNIKQLMLEKCDEILCKFNLLQAYHDQDYDIILALNTQLFGKLQDYTTLPINYFTLEKRFWLSYQSIFENTGISPSEFLTQKQVKELLIYHTQAIGFNTCSIQFGNFGNTNMQVRIGPKPVIYIHKRESYKAFDICVSILHEVYGHLARYKNGINSDYHILQWGTAYYLSTEEGLAVFQAARVEWFEKTRARLQKSYQYLPQSAGYNWKQLTQIYIKNGRTNLETIFWSILRLKRGIQDTSIIHPGTIFYKDKVYIDGYCTILSYFSDQVNNKDLKSKPYTKLTLDDIIMIWRVKIADIKKSPCILGTTQL